MSEGVPEGWATKRLSDVTTQTKGLTYKSEDYGDENNGLPFLTLKSISKSGGYSPLGLKFYKGDFKPHHLIESGDILFANTDLTRDGDVVGSPLYFDSFEFQTKPLYSMDLSKLVVDPSESVGKFLYYLLMTHRVKRFMINASAGSTVLHLDTKSVKSLPIILPPLPEQKKIASILTSVDEVIETTQKQIDKLQDLKKATMNELLTKGIGHTEFKDSELGRIPKSWEVVRLGDITKQKTLGTTERGGDYAMVPLVKMGDIQSGKVLLGSNEKVSQSKLTPQNFLSNGDFLFNTRNTPELVGKVGNFNSSKVASFDNNLLRISFFEDVSPLFMGIQFNDASFKKRLKTLVAGTTSVAAIYWNDLSRFRVVKPKIMEQTEIASIIYSINMQIDDQGKKLAQTQSLKKSLMQDLLTGKVRVQVN